MRKAAIFAALCVGLLVGALAPQAEATVAELQKAMQRMFGGGISAAGATDNQVLAWDATARQWEAADAAGGYPTLDGFHLTLSSGVAVAEDTNTDVEWDQEEYDSGGRHSTVSNSDRVTFGAADAGSYWEFRAGGGFTNAPDQVTFLRIHVFDSEDGNVASYQVRGVDQDGGSTVQVFTPPILIADGYYALLRVRHSTTTTNTFNDSGAFFSGRKVAVE